MKALTKNQMAVLDKEMVSIGIGIPVMMELAGFFTALKATAMTKNKRIIILSGTGNNGGDSLVAARHLLNWGYRTDVVLASKVSHLRPQPLHQWKILKKMRVRETKNASWKKYGLIIDGLLGFGTNRNPTENCAKLIKAANDSKKTILSIDAPSGMDSTTGKIYDPCIKAKETLTLTAPKTGLLKKGSKKKTGKISVAYMTVPETIRKKFGIKGFSEKELISTLK